LEERKLVAYIDAQSQIDMGVGIWFFRTDLPGEDRTALWLLLSEEERRAASRLYFEADRTRSAVAHARLRLILAAASGVEATVLEFGRSATGKPFLIGPTGATGLHFNLAHAGDFCAIAITRLGPVGIDIERVRSDLDVAALSAREFSRSEAAWLESLPESARRSAFYRLWTRKEAVLKAEGSGFSIALNEFDVLKDEVAIGGRMFHVRDLDAPDEYLASLAQEQKLQTRC
jgi:4'-phosphopantetheinyl transferase